MSKWVIEIPDGAICDLAYGCESGFVKMILAQLEASEDENIHKILVPRLKGYLEKCKHKQHVYIVFSDKGVYNVGPLDMVRPDHEFLSPDDMEIDNG